MRAPPAGDHEDGGLCPVRRKASGEGQLAPVPQASGLRAGISGRCHRRWWAAGSAPVTSRRPRRRRSGSGGSTRERAEGAVMSAREDILQKVWTTARDVTEENPTLDVPML